MPVLISIFPTPTTVCLHLITPFPPINPESISRRYSASMAPQAGHSFHGSTHYDPTHKPSRWEDHPARNREASLPHQLSSMIYRDGPLAHARRQCCLGYQFPHVRSGWGSCMYSSVGSAPAERSFRPVFGGVKAISSLGGFCDIELDILC